MRRVELFFVFLVEYCFIDGLSGLNWKQYDGFNPEEHENYKLLPPKNSCGTNGPVTQTKNVKIFGGYETQLGEIPWMVQWGEITNGKFGGGYCGATLISERYVLTAAHCVNASADPEKFAVRLGEWSNTGDPDSQGDLHAPPVQDIQVAQIIVHNGTPVKNAPRMEIPDIALIRLKSPAKLNYFVQPVCLPYGAGMGNFSNEDAFAAGWGEKGEGGYPYAAVLLAVKQTVIDPAECWETHHVNYNLGHMCAGGEEGKGICFGDSGGPLLWKGSFEPNISSRNYLLGITSIMLAKCATKGVPAVYQRITLLMKWILDNMRA